MDAVLIEAIQEKYIRVVQQIHEAAKSVGREPSSIQLVVVTKGHPVGHVRHAIHAGLSLFGENYVEEALEKMNAFIDHPAIKWHMIGHVQSRKARQVCENFDTLHSLDSVKLGVRLNRFAEEMERCLPVFLECNVSGEETKFGFAAWHENLWSGLEAEVKELAALRNLKISGLMTMAPYFDEAEMARPYFHRLRALRDFLTTRLPEVELKHLSMGMSGDFPVAVQEGATILRIGTAIMGSRS